MMAGNDVTRQGRHTRVPSWRMLLTYSAGVRVRVLFGGLLTFAGTVVALAQPLLAQRILTALTLRRSATTLLVALGVAVLVGAVLSAIGYYLLEYSGESVVLSMRTRMIQKILRLRVATTAQVSPGDLMSRLVADTTLLRQITTQGLVMATTGIISLIGSLVVMCLLDWVLLGVTLTSVVVTMTTIQWSARRIGRMTREVQASVAGMAMLLDRSLGAFRTVKAAGAEAGEIERLTGASRDAWRQGLRLARWQATSGTMAVLTTQVAFLLVLGVGGARVASGAIPMPTLIAFMLVMLYLGQPINSLVSAYTQYQAGMAAAGRVEEVLALAAEQPDGGTAPGRARRARLRTVVLARPNGHDLANRFRDWEGDPRQSAVDFEDVVFSYSEDTAPVHRGVTFSVPRGGMTAIVGPSGAGKSTVFALVERFYDVTSGRVLVDGRDVRDWPLDQLRASIGYVEQDAPALAGTIRDNLSLGLGTVPDDRLHQALAAARLTEFVAALPNGLDGEIGYRGNTLSGGERQRLAIARALLRSPRLLLLDEATSHLDAGNEVALKEAVATAATATTVIVVAHRLSTVVGARQIVVMDTGRVRSCGTHQRLLKTDPLYRNLAENQLLAAPAS